MVLNKKTQVCHPHEMHSHYQIVDTVMILQWKPLTCIERPHRSNFRVIYVMCARFVFTTVFKSLIGLSSRLCRPCADDQATSSGHARFYIKWSRWPCTCQQIMNAMKSDDRWTMELDYGMRAKYPQNRVECRMSALRIVQSLFQSPHSTHALYWWSVVLWRF